MVQIVAKANGVAFVLFHVEHAEGQEWLFRWRMTGRVPPAYMMWRELSTMLPRVVIHTEIRGCAIDVEWRENSGAPWRQVDLREAAIGSARFAVTSSTGFDAPMGFRAMAEVAGFVACYHFGALTLPAGTSREITGRADGPFPENVLLAPGEFVSEEPMIRIENAAPSEGSLITPSNPLPVLSDVPGASERRIYAYRNAQGEPTPIPFTHHA